MLVVDFALPVSDPLPVASVDVRKKAPRIWNGGGPFYLGNYKAIFLGYKGEGPAILRGPPAKKSPDLGTFGAGCGGAGTGTGTGSGRGPLA